MQRVSDLERRLAQIEAFARTLVQGFRVVDERRHILEPLLRDNEAKAALAKKLGKSAGVQAFNHLVPLLTHDLVRELARLLLDNDKRVASLRNIYRKAREPALHKAIRQGFISIPEGWSKPDLSGIPEEMRAGFEKTWAEQDAAEYAQSFDKGWGTVESAVAALERDEVAKKIGTVRDKYLAHLEMTPLDEEPVPFSVKALGLTYNDVLSFADTYAESVYELGRIITGNVYDSEGFKSAHREAGSSLWRLLGEVPG